MSSGKTENETDMSVFLQPPCCHLFSVAPLSSPCATMPPHGRDKCSSHFLLLERDRLTHAKQGPSFYSPKLKKIKKSEQTTNQLTKQTP